MKTYPSKEELEKYFSYNPETGILTNRINRYKALKDNEAGHVRVGTTGKQYRMVEFQSSFYYVHRIILIMMGIELVDGLTTDHINGNGLDNRFCNLRQVTKIENARNQTVRRDSTSGVTGVYWDTNCKKWRANIKINQVKIHLGAYDNKIDAVAARNNAEAKYGFTKAGA